MSHAGYHTKIDCMCTYCELRYKKYFHPHTWRDLRKLDTKKMIGDKIYYRDAQYEICKKYNVIIPLYRTKRERRIDFIKGIWWTTKRILKLVKRALDAQHDANQRRKTYAKNPKNKGSFFENLTMSERDYKSLTGKTTDQDLSFIVKGNKRDYSALLNHKRNQYSALVGNRKTPKFDMGKPNYSGLIGSRKNNIRGTVKKLWK